MNCSKCGMAVNSWNAMCPSCGTPIEFEATPAPVAAAQSKKSTAAVSVSQFNGLYKVIGIFAIIVGLISLVMLVMNCVTILQRAGFENAIRHGLGGIITPILVLVCGGAAVMATDRFGPPAALLGGALIFSNLLSLIVPRFLNYMMGPLATVAWSTLGFVFFLVSLILIALTILLASKQGLDRHWVNAVITGGVGLVLGVLVFLFAPVIVRLYLGRDVMYVYEDVIRSLRIIAISLPFMGIGFSLSYALLVKRGPLYFAQGAVRYIIVVAGIIATVNFFQMGIPGVAISIIAAEVLRCGVAGLLSLNA